MVAMKLIYFLKGYFNVIAMQKDFALFARKFGNILGNTCISHCFIVSENLMSRFMTELEVIIASALFLFDF